MSGVDERRAAEDARKVEAYDAARAQVKREGYSRAEYVLRAELAEQRADEAEKALRRIVAIDTGYGWIGEAMEPIHIAREALAAAVVSAEPTEEQG